jgi:hypothetical protein
LPHTRAQLGRRKDALLGIPGTVLAELRAKLLEAGTWSGELKHRTKGGRELTVESRIVLDRIGCTMEIALHEASTIGAG